jgi:hypothetical protein
MLACEVFSVASNLCAVMRHVRVIVGTYFAVPQFAIRTTR